MNTVYSYNAKKTFENEMVVSGVSKNDCVLLHTLHDFSMTSEFTII